MGLKRTGLLSCTSGPPQRRIKRAFVGTQRAATPSTDTWAFWGLGLQQNFFTLMDYEDLSVNQLLFTYIFYNKDRRTDVLATLNKLDYS